MNDPGFDVIDKCVFTSFKTNVKYHVTQATGSKNSDYDEAKWFTQ